MGIDPVRNFYKLRNPVKEASSTVRVEATELAKNFVRYQGVALTEPVTVMRNGRDRLVMLSVEEYRRLKRRHREVLSLADFTEEDIAAVEKSEPSPESEQFNHEVE